MIIDKVLNAILNSSSKPKYRLESLIFYDTHRSIDWIDQLLPFKTLIHSILR